MRYATVTVSPGSGGFHPGYYELTQEASITREFIHHIYLLDGDTIILLYQIRGDHSKAKEVLEGSPNLFAYDIAGSKGDSTLSYVYIHCQAMDPAKSLLSLIQQSDLILDLPLTFTADGNIRATVVGDENTLQRTLAEATDIDGVDIGLEKTGDYHPEAREFRSLLTDRQRQILKSAIDMGYYHVPRHTTIDDIANEVGLSTATVGEHLQKIEARILSQVLY